MSKVKKNYVLNSVTVDLGCIGTCRKPKISSILHQNPKIQRPRASSSCSGASPSSWSTTTTTFSSIFNTPSSLHSSTDTGSEIKSLKAVQGFGRIGGDSVAVEKDSDDPYLDFRHSMLEMILKKNIYAKDDLKELLNCFLQLNSPYYHWIIVRAFTEIWNGIYSVKPNASSSPNLHGMWKSRDAPDLRVDY